MRTTSFIPFVAVIGLLAMGGLHAEGASISLPLTFETVESGDDAFLRATVELDSRFAEIDSAYLTYQMPEEYQGWWATTGNSTSGQHLTFGLAGTAGTQPAINGFGSMSPFGGRVQRVYPDREATTTLYLKTQLSQLVDIERLQAEEELLESLAVGTAYVYAAEVDSLLLHPLPAGEVVERRYSFSVPPAFSSVELTIVGVLVPEPSTTVLLLFGLVTLVGYRRAAKRLCGT